ncbi:5-formyltetrahydrofolate cyclo-ligase [Rheinheimera sp.]|uniref:5-formyltetrahydrofolate cyclo-ligase n=1 Tax=Rheinheimera sp. TaxID=1869214 RepID=UPI00307E4934
MSSSRAELRTLTRQRRRALSDAEQQQAANELTIRLLHWPELASCQHIALYLTNDGEISTQPLITALWARGKNLYLPLLHPLVPGYLLFQQFTPDTPLTLNKFGIGEPALNCSQIFPVQQLDLVLTPLVAFDAQGHRLGMGGGFYDRTLSQLPSDRTRPVLMGLAHQCQQVEQVPVEAWDQPLRFIATPDRLWQFD